MLVAAFPISLVPHDRHSFCSLSTENTRFVSLHTILHTSVWCWPVGQELHSAFAGEAEMSKPEPSFSDDTLLRESAGLPLSFSLIAQYSFRNLNIQSERSGELESEDLGFSSGFGTSL